MRKTSLIIALIVAMCAFDGASALAYPGGGPGSGPANGAGSGLGNGPQGGSSNGCWWGDPSAILAGTPFTHSGTVVSLGYSNQGGGGGGLVLDTGSGQLTFYGTGPYWYWAQLGVAWPVVGDSLTVSGYTATNSGTAYNMLMSITTASGQTVPLRDETTGWPLWW